MGIVENHIALQLPVAVDRTLYLASKVGDTKKFETTVMDNELKTDLFKFLNKIKNHAMSYQARQCFFNSQITLAYAEKDKKFKGRFKYFEGLASSARLPLAIHHAWLMLDDSHLVDLTWTNDFSGRLEDLSDRIVADIPVDWEYIGLSFDFEFLKKQLGKSKIGSISLLDDYQNRFPVTAYYEQLAEDYMFSRKK
jgi:hypothetical protein